MKLTFLILVLVGHSVFAGDWSQQKIINASGPLDYFVYAPESNGKYRGMILALHGCKQSPMDFAAVTRLTTLADRENVILVFPEQPVWQNVDRCWNWFLPINQTRLTGEPSQFMMALAKTEAHFEIDRTHVFVVGMSSGAIMANVMASCFPDVFAGAGLHSGIEYANPLMPQDAITGKMTCPILNSSLSGSLAYSCSGLSPHRIPKIIIFHGDQDSRVYPCNSDSVFEQWVQMEDWADDHLANGSISKKQARSHTENPPNRYRYVQRDLADPYGWRIRQIRVLGMAHAWSGGPPDRFASDPKGPDATTMMWNFFIGK